MKYGITGPCFAVSSACASSSHAIGLGMMMIRSGLVDKAVVGGAEAMRSYATLKGWEAIRAVSPTLSRPFSRDRNGMVIGEGAAVFVLEADKPGIEVAGFGMSADAGDIISPSLGGPVAAMSAALHDAGMFPPDIGYINAHGTGTPLNDKNEAAAIRQVFSKPPLVSSTKPAHGHTIGAAGAIELYVAMKALETGIAPPTLNFTEADPECGLDCVPNVSARFNGSAVASNSFAFGGLNSCLILRG
jgi:nodulation protein E